MASARPPPSRDRNEMTEIGFRLENIQSRFNHEQVERVCSEAFAFLFFTSGVHGNSTRHRRCQFPQINKSII